MIKQNSDLGQIEVVVHRCIVKHLEVIKMSRFGVMTHLKKPLLYKQNSFKSERIGGVSYKTNGGRALTCLVVKMVDMPLDASFLSYHLKKGGKYE